MIQLTRAQREAFFAGQVPKISYPGEKACPVTIGETYRLAPRFWFEVRAIVRDANLNHVLRYELFDRRMQPRLVRRTPPPLSEGNFGQIRRGFDEYGYPPAETDSRKTGVESSYVSTQHGTVAECGEGVDDRELAKFAVEAKLNDDQKASLAQARRERGELEARLMQAREEARRRGIDISSPERVIERQLLRIEQRVFEGRQAAA